MAISSDGSSDKKISIYNVKFSPNLGDGILAECLEEGLVHHGISPEAVTTYDLAGRTNYEPGKTSRNALLLILSPFPEGIRELILLLPLTWMKIRKWGPHYEKGMVGANTIVIGGGNLFTDMDLNFPTKLSTLLNLSSGSKLPVMIYGVGVGKRWSAKGLRAVREALAKSHVVRVSVRDRSSLVNFEKHFGDVVSCTPYIVRDPGLAVAQLRPKFSDPKKNLVGVCITAPLAIRYHSEVDVKDEFLINWYLELLAELKLQNYHVCLFTNGSPEDVDCAAELYKRFGDQNGVSLSARSKNPEALIKLISGFYAVVAFRMHAIITAVSFGIGVVGLRWDSKLDAFMQSAELEKFIVSADETQAKEVVDLLGKALLHASSNQGCSKLIEESLRDIGELAKTLKFKT